jgi:hypothetical protein
MNAPLTILKDIYPPIIIEALGKIHIFGPTLDPFFFYIPPIINADRGTLLHAHLNIINNCLKHGYSMEPWKHILNIMILKEPSNTKIHRLRVIHLFEADYNLIISVKSRQQIKHAEERELLNEGQYGSRSGREAPDVDGCAIERKMVRHTVFVDERGKGVANRRSIGPSEVVSSVESTLVGIYLRGHVGV